MAPLLLQTGAAGLAWWRVRAAPSLPPVAAELRDAYRLFSLNAVQHEQRLAGAFAVLEAKGVTAVLGKGWAVARQYPRPGLRPYGDVDLYVPAEQHAAAARALADAQASGVDLHRGFAELDDYPPGELIDQARQAVVAGVPVRVFAPEHHLRLLVLHMLRHGVLRPLWLCDVALALEARPPDFDWTRLGRGSTRRGQWVFSALALAHELLGARLDGVPPRAGARLPRWLRRSVLRQWGVFVPPHGSRSPIAARLRAPVALLSGLVVRWPNPVEATVGVGGPFNALPRLPFQVGACVVRTAQFARRLAASRTA